MAAIPRKLYAFIEKKLYEQPYEAVSDAAEALITRREEAFGVKSPGSECSGGRSGGVSNRVQDGVMRVIAAEENLETANRWAFVLTRLSEIFEGTEVAEVADLFYVQKMTEADIAIRISAKRAQPYTRQTIRRFRDKYVIRAALLAAENGLVRMSEHEDGRA